MEDDDPVLAAVEAHNERVRSVHNEQTEPSAGILNAPAIAFLAGCIVGPALSLPSGLQANPEIILSPYLRSLK